MDGGQLDTYARREINRLNQIAADKNETKSKQARLGGDFLNSFFPCFLSFPRLSCSSRVALLDPQTQASIAAHIFIYTEDKKRYNQSIASKAKLSILQKTPSYKPTNMSHVAKRVYLSRHPLVFSPHLTG